MLVFKIESLLLAVFELTPTGTNEGSFSVTGVLVLGVELLDRGGLALVGGGMVSDCRRDGGLLEG